jgi:hypothetical protein
VAVRDDIEGLAAFEGRVAGSDAERRAARHLEKRLGELGREAVLEPISVFPAWHLSYALHVLVAIVGSVLAVEVPLAGTTLLAIALVSLVGDATGSFHLLRRLTGRRASQNVVSTEDAGKPGTLILCARYDAARGGAMMERRYRFPPLAPLFWSTLVVLVCAALRLAGIDGTALTAVQFVPTVVLIVHLPLFMDIALSDPAPGANNNASGVATVLRLAGRLGGRLESFDLWVLFPGAGQSMALGQHEFVRARGRELERGRTVFLTVDEVGVGEPQWSQREGLLLTVRTHPQLRELASETGARPGTRYAAGVGGYPAISLFCRRGSLDQIEDGDLEEAYQLCEDLIERIDDRLGAELTR